MENLGIYAIEDKDSKTYSNVFLSSKDYEAGSFILKNIKVIYDEVPKNLKDDFVQRVYNSNLVKLGELNLMTGEIIPGKNFIYDFNCEDIFIKKEVVDVNGTNKENV